MTSFPPTPCVYCRQPAQWVITGRSTRESWSAAACTRDKARAETRAAQVGPVTARPIEGAPEPDQPDLFTTTEEGTPE